MFIFLVCAYLIAFATNLIPSLRHPDSTMSFLHPFATALFIIVLLIYIKQAACHAKAANRLKAFLILGFLSGFVVYVMKIFESTIMDYAILDMIASIQYPFYLLFTTPLFGFNYLLDINYEIYSLLMSGVYIIGFILVTYFNKVTAQKVSL